MARGDIKIHWGADTTFQQQRNVASGTAKSINEGEPTKVSSTNIAIMVDGDGTTSQRFTGIAASDSTDTVAAAGVCNVWFPLPGIIYSAKALLGTAVDTAAEVEALKGKRVYFDLTSTAWTVDTAQSDATANGLEIVGGDYRALTVHFLVSPKVSIGNVTA